MDDVMRSRSTHPQRHLDITISIILTLLLILSILFRISPIDFMNFGFPILRQGDLKFTEKFILFDPPIPKRTTGVYNTNKIRYEIFFQVQDSSQVFPDSNGTMRPVGFTGHQYLSRFSNTMAAVMSLEQSYKEYVEDEGDFPVLRTDVPLKKFNSKADNYLLWCNQYSRDIDFNVEEVHSCYFWSVYDNNFSQIRISMWPIAGGGRQYSIDLFEEIIIRAENKLLEN